MWGLSPLPLPPAPRPGARFLDCSNIVDFIGIGETPRPPKPANETEAGMDVFDEEGDQLPNMFLVQEFCNAGSAQNLLESNMALGVQRLKRYSVVDALTYAIHIAKGLEYLHLASPMIIHRDLKPGGAPAGGATCSRLGGGDA